MGAFAPILSSMGRDSNCALRRSLRDIRLSFQPCDFQDFHSSCSHKIADSTRNSSSFVERYNFLFQRLKGHFVTAVDWFMLIHENAHVTVVLASRLVIRISSQRRTSSACGNATYKQQVFGIATYHVMSC